MTHPRVLTVLLVACLALPIPSSAQDQKPLDNLKALFEKDPAAGLEQAEQLFHAPQQSGNLDGMMAIIRLAAQACPDGHGGYFYTTIADAMIGAALPIAEAAGNWEALGSLHEMRMYMTYECAGNTAADWVGQVRARKAVDLATAAYARAGKTVPALGVIADQIDRGLTEGQLVGGWWYALPEKRTELLGDYGPLASQSLQAVIEGRDAEAVSAMRDICRRIQGDRQNPHYSHVVGFLTHLAWIAGAGDVIQSLTGLVDAAPERTGQDDSRREELTYYLMDCCCLAWKGRNDAAYQTWYRYYRELRRINSAAGPGVTVHFLHLLIVMRRDREAAELTREWVAWSLSRPPVADLSWSALSTLVRPATPWDVRLGLLERTLRVAVYTSQQRLSWPALPASWETYIPLAAPPGDAPDWWVQAGQLLVNYSYGFVKPEERAAVATQAALAFDKAKRPDLAVQATELAKSFAADDPKAKLQCALAVANAAASAGNWEDLIKGLEPALAGVAPSGTAVQAALLLQQAQSNLGKKDEAAKWLAKATELLGQARLPASERVTYLMNITALTADKAAKLALLKQAETAATEADLGPLQEKISQQLAELALSTGDLTTAEQSLEQIIERLEANREALAFDPILRQQWFADNLGPYQKLLRVEALRQNAPEALWVAEKMRARALSDQLSWQKVDMGVRLPKDLQDRLSALREARTKTYALLQRAMGGAQLTGSDVRGAYIPIRGSLGNDQPLTEADLKELRGLIDSLQKEEAALGGAIREQIPAYAAASDAPVLTGTRLIEKVMAQKDLALLHYTLCDEGLVVVACGPGARPKVALLPINGEDLWQQIGQFRQDIWERKPEANLEAVKLYNQLVQPVEGCLYGAKRLWVVGDGALQLVPFGALIGSDRNYLVAHYAIATTPSLTLALASRGKRTPGQGAVIVAAPDTGALAMTATDDKRGAYMPIRGMYIPIRGAYMPIRGEGISSALTSMASVPLPGAKAEGEAIAPQFQPVTLLTDKQATKAKLIELGGQCDLLHIATHGYADPDYPEFSGLLLAGEGEKPYDTLTAQEVYMWSLKARLVTLSACQTAMGKTVEGEGVMGLTRAFIYAGAQDVLCTLWPVADESTKALMVAFYKNLKQGQPIEEALRFAQGDMAASPATRDPFFWAGFVAVRGPE